MSSSTRSTRRVFWSAVLGIVVASVGTGIHRLNPPWGVVFALVIVFSAAVMTRARVGRPGVIALAVMEALTVFTMSRLGPGGDVLIVADSVGKAWLASVAAVLAVAILPRRWFSDEPIERRSDRVGVAP